MVLGEEEEEVVIERSITFFQSKKKDHNRKKTRFACRYANYIQLKYAHDQSGYPTDPGAVN